MENIERESTVMTANGPIVLPPGFRFYPTDDELVHEYLVRKCSGEPLPSSHIRDVNIYNFDPWDLPEKADSSTGKNWYFFSPRDRKYPKSSRPNRKAGNGFWKATGLDKPIGPAIKKSLVFNAGKPKNCIKTNWIMHEYRMADIDRSATGEKGNLQLDWVLCRIYNKKGIIEKHTVPEPGPSVSTKLPPPELNRSELANSPHGQVLPENNVEVESQLPGFWDIFEGLILDRDLDFLGDVDFRSSSQPASTSFSQPFS